MRCEIYFVNSSREVLFCLQLIWRLTCKHSEQTHSLEFGVLLKGTSMSECWHTNSTGPGDWTRDLSVPSEYPSIEPSLVFPNSQHLVLQSITTWLNWHPPVMWEPHHAASLLTEEDVDGRTHLALLTSEAKSFSLRNREHEYSVSDWGMKMK